MGMTDEDIQHLQQELERLRAALTKANNAASFMYEEPYRTLLGLSIGDHVLFQGVPELKFRLDKTMQEVNRLTNENAALRRELYPPELPKKELKYWIVTWLVFNQYPYADVCSTWESVMLRKQGLELATDSISHIRILQQSVLL